MELRDFAQSAFVADDAQAIWGYVQQRLRKKGMEAAIAGLLKLAAQERLLLLFDGVDEVPIDKRADVWRAIAALDGGPLVGTGGWRPVVCCLLCEEAPMMCLR